MMFERGGLDEEITVCGQADHVCFEAVGSWGDGYGIIAGTRRHFIKSFASNPAKMNGKL